MYVLISLDNIWFTSFFNLYFTFCHLGWNKTLDIFRSYDIIFDSHIWLIKVELILFSDLKTSVAIVLFHMSYKMNGVTTFFGQRSMLVFLIIKYNTQCSFLHLFYFLCIGRFTKMPNYKTVIVYCSVQYFYLSDHNINTLTLSTAVTFVCNNYVTGSNYQLLASTSNISILTKM